MEIVVAGIIRDSTFNGICFMLENLSQTLPNFAHRIIQLDPGNWQSWLKRTCNNYGWIHSSKMPLLVWYENGSNGIQKYIGGVGELESIIKNRYGILLQLSTNNSKDLNYDYLLAEKHTILSESKLAPLKNDVCRISLTAGCGRTISAELLTHLCNIEELVRKYDRIIIQFHGVVSVSRLNLHSLNRIENNGYPDHNRAETIVTQVSELRDALIDCDILIVLDSYPREEYESIEVYVKRNYKASKTLAKEIFRYSPNRLKIILSSSGAICLWANVFVKELKGKIDNSQIVAVTAHHGLEIVYEFMKSLHQEIPGIGGPPVWGFIGINRLVDLTRTVQEYLLSVKSSKYRFLNFESRKKKFSNSQDDRQFRWLMHLVHLDNNNPYNCLEDRKNRCSYEVGQAEEFQKIKSLCILLKLWFSDDDDVFDKVINLGILSDGTFEIPKGIYFSQPVNLKVDRNGNRIWIPCSKFPKSQELNILENYIETAITILKDLTLI